MNDEKKMSRNSPLCISVYSLTMLNLRSIRICAAAFLLSAIAMSAQEPQTPIFHTETHLVDFTFSVRRPDGTLVKGLNREDFTVTEDGVPQKLAFFGKEADLPLTLGLIVDASDSQSKFFKRHHKDIEKFLNTAMRPQDEVFSICFGNHLRVTSDKTSSIPSVMAELERFDKGERNYPELAPEDNRDNQSGGGTALYDAIYYSVGAKLAQASGRRRALILFTDGEENASAHDLLDAIEAARENDTLIYAIRYTNEKAMTPHSHQGIAALHHLSSETGGSDFDALHTNVSEAFQQIADELRSLYSIGYYTPNKKRDGTFRRVIVTTTDPTYSVRARTGYYAR
jgi:Ca-activated chloride channel homolog